jgi:peptidoglycan LD-endopeptidase LytH
MKTLARALIGVFVVCLALPVAQPFISRAWFVYTLATQEPPLVLPDPIASQRGSRVVDSWGNSRSGGRRHSGIDIFAAKDTPVLSTTSSHRRRVSRRRTAQRVIASSGKSC